MSKKQEKRAVRIIKKHQVENKCFPYAEFKHRDVKSYGGAEV